MHVDGSVYFSKYRLVMMAVFVLVVGVLAIGLFTALWQWLVLAVLFLVVCVLLFRSNQLIHIVSSEELWECLVHTVRQDELWLIQVDELTDYGFCVVLEGVSVEPMVRSVRFVIFVDMLDDDEYRKLRVLARF